MENEIESYLQFCLLDKNLSRNTVDLYRYYLTAFCQWGKPQMVLYPTDITKDVIHNYRIYLSERQYRTATIKRVTQNYFLIAVRGFLRFLASQGTACLPADQVMLGKVRDRVIKFLEPEHIQALFSAPDATSIAGLRDRALLEVLFATGLRVSEVAQLNRDQINLERLEFGIIGKGGKARVVFLSKDAAACLEIYLSKRTDDAPAVFIRHHGRPSRLTVRSIERLVEKYGRIARLPIRISPHVLRHCFATDLLMNGADLRSVQELLGHANVSTTQIYTHVTNLHLREVHEAFHSRWRQSTNSGTD